MSDQLVLVSLSELKEIIHSTTYSSMTAFYAEKEQLSSQDQPIKYFTRKEVKELLHTTYPTLQKYSDSGLLKITYFGRRVLYREDELNLALPHIKKILRENKSRAA